MYRKPVCAFNPWGKRIHLVFLFAFFAVPLAGCGAAPQIYSKASHQAITLQAGELEVYGVAFITPSTVTGQEEEKQAVAFTFAEVLKRERPQIRCVTLSETLSAVNRAGFAREYRHMYNDYRSSGLFERSTLLKVAQETGTKYLVQLKLQGFNQGTYGRFGLFGLRILETKFAMLRLFCQVWDAQEGAIAWEGIQETQPRIRFMAVAPFSGG